MTQMWQNARITFLASSDKVIRISFNCSYKLIDSEEAGDNVVFALYFVRCGGGAVPVVVTAMV